VLVSPVAYNKTLKGAHTQATEGDACGTRPGMVAASKRAKYDAHVAFGGWTKEEAQIGYVNFHPIYATVRRTAEPEGASSLERPTTSSVRAATLLCRTPVPTILLRTVCLPR
jgi:hypothetical protein